MPFHIEVTGSPAEHPDYFLPVRTSEGPVVYDTKAVAEMVANQFRECGNDISGYCVRVVSTSTT